MIDNYDTETKDYDNAQSVTAETIQYQLPSIKVWAQPDAKIPTVSTKGSGGLDLYVNDFIVNDNEIVITTGVHVEIPPGHVGLVMPRSSTGVCGFQLKNTVGVIDADYRGDIRLYVHRFEAEEDIIDIGKKVAQLIILPVCPFPIEQVGSLEDLSETERGSNGFGSTGV